jgi:hypothetical protein
MYGYIFQASRKDPAAAGEWVSGIGDPKLRTEAATVVFNALSARQPSAAQSWLEALPGTDPRWRSWFLRHR